MQEPDGEKAEGAVSDELLGGAERRIDASQGRAGRAGLGVAADAAGERDAGKRANGVRPPAAALNMLANAISR